MQRNIPIIDVHTHQYFYNNYARIYYENTYNNVVFILENGIDTESNSKIIELANKYEKVYFALGLHPTSIVKMNNNIIENEIERIINCKNQKFLAIGEIGLDFYWIKDGESRNKEVFWFKKLLEVAEKINKPVILHTRNAENETLDILESYNVKVVLHSFWKPKLVKRAVDNGYYISVPAFVYKEKGLQRIVRDTPLDLLLTETDAPFLDPIEKRNNKSWKIIYGLKKIAEIKNEDILEVSRFIIKNVENLFNISISQ